MAPFAIVVLAALQGAPQAAGVIESPPARIDLTAPQDSLYVGVSLPLMVTGWTESGERVESVRATFESATSSVAEVDAAGRVYGLRRGTATITARSGEATASTTIRVVPNPAAAYSIRPAPGTLRTGDVVRFTVRAQAAGGADAGSLLPAWAVSGAGAEIEAEGSEGVFVAERPGRYRVSALIGKDLVRSVAVEVVERQAESVFMKVGRGPIATHHSGDVWVFEGLNGRDYAYVGTYWHDWMIAFDVTDPANPVPVDSVQVDARRINDVKIHPNRRIGIITREGASSRRNGIVILDLSAPAHPKILSEYTETVTGGVHNVWIRGDVDLVYACHNGTSDLHIIDISNPLKPREVGRWGLEKEDKTLHDVIVQDGYAYLSYWDDGVVMLDVGAGTHGGTPTRPSLVSQFKYPIGNTHVAWRHGRYLFAGDEIFPPGWNADAPIDARGYIHVIDYADAERPREVARYEVPEAGAHNVWVEDDVLYVGYYQGGLRAVDVSGELRGDLYRQGRELSVIKTSDADSRVPNWPMAWGAQLFKGHIYTSDFNSGLWVTRLQRSRTLVP